MTTTAQLDSPTEQQLQTPPCPHFGPCGGCQLQNLTYQAQLEQKRHQLRSLLDSGSLTIPEIHVHSGPPLGYRNRVRFTLAEHRGLIRAGYIAAARAGDPTPHDIADPLDEAVESPSDAPQHIAHASFLPVTQCPISADLLWKATEVFLAEVNRRSITWVERAPFTLDQLELFTTADESQLQLSVFLRTAAKGLPDRFETELATLCEAVRERIPQLTGAGMYLLPTRSARSRRAEQPRPGPGWGTRGLTYTVVSPGLAQGNCYWVPRGAFFQINRFLVPELVDLVTANRSGALAWDLYAGVGLFTRALAPRFQRITAVEAADPSFTALASAKIPNRHAVKSTTVEFLEHAVIQRDRPDLIVLDPPRTGAGQAVCEMLGRIAAPEIVYVSCSPHTLPGDLATLTASGYSITQLHLVDLFPQTSHIETVAVLRHTKK
jgi:23S rRNA (uracil1939-C5)-methyltransferase